MVDKKQTSIGVIIILLVSSLGTYIYIETQDQNPDSPGKKEFDIPSAAWSHPIGEYYEAGKPHVDNAMVDDGTLTGLPLGGLGSGSIGRSHRGDFSRWHLDIGNHIYDPIEADQFSVFIREAEQSHAHVLNPMSPTQLTDWNWDMPYGAGTYHALYPHAWYEYEWNKLPVQMVQNQFSPVIPDNYKESSYPVGVFEWQVYNPGSTDVTMSIMFTWQNLIYGGKDDLLKNIVEENSESISISMTRDAAYSGKEFDGTYAISAAKDTGYDISYLSTFFLDDAAGVWQDFADDGILSNTQVEGTGGGREIAGALAASFTIKSGESMIIPFSLAWDLPIAEFGFLTNENGFIGGGTQWYKRYTKFYGVDGHSATTIATDALGNYSDWEQQLEDWQDPILDDPNRPDWYKCALFNELYYLIDGGTMWENGVVTPNKDPFPQREYGRFAYLETYDYRLYNTFDVHYYASFALVQLWPELQKSLVSDFIDAVKVNDTRIRYVYADGSPQQRKPFGAVPHDIGNPLADPWYAINDYMWQDSNIWKDLNSKLVLQIYRDYKLTNDADLINSESWDAIYLSLEYLHVMDTTGDHLPDHLGIPDQTYDTWPMKGASAYSGSLWIAALEAAIEIATLRGDTGNITRYTSWLVESKVSFEDLLWNGEYFLFDASGGEVSDSIMSDQLAGQWYAYATGLDPVAKKDYILSALDKIYNYNVLKFGGGEMGPVNGMRPNGSIDLSAEQSQEVWTGTAYGVAATMYHAGMIDQAWTTAYGVYNVVYNRGFWFRTPEAYLENGDFRASMYMRPLSIWGLEYAILQSSM